MTYRDSQNQVVLDRLVREVKALNPVFLNLHIKGQYEVYRTLIGRIFWRLFDIADSDINILFQMLLIGSTDQGVKKPLQKGEGSMQEKYR